MMSFRKNILKQIEQIEAGRIFTFRDLTYDIQKTSNVAVLLSEQTRQGKLVRFRKGAYYRPKKSSLGLGSLPVFQDEQFRYLRKKLRGYITGPYIYNKMGLTEQTSSTITVATANPMRRFRFKNIDVECVKAYVSGQEDDDLLPYLRVLDAIKDMNRIPGTTAQDIYDRIKRLFFEEYKVEDIEKIVSLAKSYPPRVRRTVADILGDIGRPSLQADLARTLLPSTRFSLNYKTL